MSIQSELSAWQDSAAKIMLSYGIKPVLGHDKITNEIVVRLYHRDGNSVHVYPDGNIENTLERTKFSEDPGKKLVQFIDYMTIFSPLAE